MATFGDNVWFVRVAQDMTQTELAKEAKTTQATISRIESGEIKDPRIGVVKRIAAALDESIEHLVD